MFFECFMVTNQFSLEKGVEFIKICFRMRDHSCLTLDEDFYHIAQVIFIKVVDFPRHNVNLGFWNHEKNLATFWGVGYLTIHECNIILKYFQIWASDFWKIEFLNFFCSKIVRNLRRSPPLYNSRGGSQ